MLLGLFFRKYITICLKFQSREIGNHKFNKLVKDNRKEIQTKILKTPECRSEDYEIVII